MGIPGATSASAIVSFKSGLGFTSTPSSSNRRIRQSPFVHHAGVSRCSDTVRVTGLHRERNGLVLLDHRPSRLATALRTFPLGVPPPFAASLIGRSLDLTGRCSCGWGRSGDGARGSPLVEEQHFIPPRLNPIPVVDKSRND